MSERIFDNVKITSSFDVPETGGNLVSGETIGKHFGKIAKHMEDKSIHHTVDDALSSTSTNPVQNKVVNTALNSKTQRFSLGAVTAKTWTVFATTPNTNPTANVSATFLISDLDNVASASQGAWIVQVSNRGSVPTMKVVTLIQPTKNVITFGCYAVESQSVFKFGVCVDSYRGTTNITVLGNTGVTIGSILSTTTIPNGWTVVTPLRYAENKNMTGATASANGTSGLVPLPVAGAQTKFLRGDGTWQMPDLSAMITGLSEAITTPTDNDFYVGQYTNGGTDHPVYFRRKMSNLWAYIKTKLTNATTSANGLMSASDKTKLDGVATGATKNQVCTFTTDIAVSDWGADSNGGYSCTKTITGVLATDIPEVDVVLSTDRAAAMTQLAALECLCDGTVITGDDTVKLWCYNNKPTVAITVRLKVVR